MVTAHRRGQGVSLRFVELRSSVRRVSTISLMASLVLGSLIGSACSNSTASDPNVVIGPLGTVPGVRSLVQPPTSPPGYGEVSLDPPIVGGRAETVGQAAAGSRLLMIGD